MKGVDTAVKDTTTTVNGNNFHLLVSALELIQCSKSYNFLLPSCVAMISVAQKSVGRSKFFVLLLKMGNRGD